ncbi:hypothetical protein [Flavobacterium sp. ACN6]|uniref:hypothetical protein n=1 Tax=Flavobacterium sp. ACN6 TaxID=1920426 RepID=UPI000BB30209|nr:hypothetical protein [Flavobacterium sp. ACN6]PBJ07335.1 hypothetical protein BSF42_38750 [Flavobacterium sp. ACN6]
MSYNIFLDNQKIGNSHLEKADAPMGVVSGKINFTEVDLDYNYFSNYCKKNSIKTDESKEDKFISTQIIPALKVYNSKEVEIKGIGCYIEGIDSEEFEINIIGIPYPLYEEEFPQHVNEYRESFK